MKNSKIIDAEVTRKKPILTPEQKENQLVGLAVDLAEKQLRDGTASTAVIVHFLKLGTENAKLERLKMEKEIVLLGAKAENVELSMNSNSLALEAIDALKSYEPSDG